MSNLADAVVRFLCTIQFSGEDLPFDEDWVVKYLEETIYEIENDYSDQKRQALKDAAARSLKSLLREPDEYGYTPRKLLKPDHRAFLETFAAGQFSGRPV